LRYQYRKQSYMKKSIAFLFLVGITFISCNKDDDTTNNCTMPADLVIDQLNSRNVLLSWDGRGETAFELEYGPTGFAVGNGTVERTSRIPYTVDGLEPETSYELYLRANCGSDGFSSDLRIQFETPFDPDACNVPLELTLVSVGDTTIRVNWLENTETAWQVEYGPVGFPLGTGETIGTSESTALLEGLVPGTTYEIYVRANCGSDGFSDYTDALVVTTDS